MSAEECDEEVYRNGEIVCTFHASKAVTEEWVKKIAEISGQRVDWHYVGGYAVVKYLGKRAPVVRAVEAHKDELFNKAVHFRLVNT